MKKVAFLVAMMVFGVANLAQAAGLYHAELNKFNIDSKLHWGSQVQSGFVELDLAKREATLYLFVMHRCPPGRYCAQFMPAPFIAKLPIVTQKQTDCGTQIFTAKTDRRPVDGTAEFLEVTDNTANHCPTFNMLEATEATYRTWSARNNSDTWSRFSGNRLQSIPPVSAYGIH